LPDLFEGLAFAYRLAHPAWISLASSGICVRFPAASNVNAHAGRAEEAFAATIFSIPGYFVCHAGNMAAAGGFMCNQLKVYSALDQSA
jgi:hypothetical protein